MHVPVQGQAKVPKRVGNERHQQADGCHYLRPGLQYTIRRGVR
jgi:hypothetical protein